MVARKKPTVATTTAKTTDSFQNFRAQLGIGAQNLLSGAQYGFNPITRNRQQLEYMFRGSWLVRAAVKTIADDMTREGIELTSDIEPDDIAKIKQGFSRLKIWQAFNECLCWSRLYGGAIGIVLIDGQKLETPLRLDTVSKGQFRGICVLDRWMVAPPHNEVITAYGPDMGRPKFYDIIGDSLKLPRSRVHHSRVLRFDGEELPYYQRVAENGWGLSVLEPIYDQLVAFDSAITGTGQLIFKAHLRTLKIEKLRQILSMGGAAKTALLEQMNNMRLFQSSEGLTLLDGSDEFEAHSFTFTGLSDIIQQFGSFIAGAIETPVTRLFGTSPGGLNATGQGDLQTYYDHIKQKQESDMRGDVLKVVQLLHRSILGRAPNGELDFEFVSLWQLDQNTKADIAQKMTATVLSAAQEGVVSRKVALEELQQQADITGVWTNITQEDVDEAKNDPPPQMESQQPPAPELGGPGQKPAMGAVPGQGSPASTAPDSPKPQFDPHGLAGLLKMQ